MIGSMDSGNCASKCKDNSLKLIKNSDKVCTDETNRVIIDALVTTRQGNKESSLGPITSDANRGIGEFPYKFNSPPIEVKNAQNHSHFDPDTTINQESMVSVNHGSPRTPKDGIFDPFAPGPEGMVFAPSYWKYVDEMRITFARRLNFDISVGTVGSVNHRTAADSISDEEMFESDYENLLEVIVSNQAEGFLIEFSNIECDSDGSKTPPSAPCLNGASDTCPGAPIKLTERSSVIVLGFCRKLEF
ncbi:Regulatory-associated of TOR 1-like protein [Gossypium australe]|uniref:Regulatory-associated of TOR 1-like protein n=1 Tax=Gossypium australe TaxID=47621 RepID=A0A5B6X7I9_9ROSI|nr:Regulatory-associated of TOR 1-like protein [Gossypium australe]